MNEYSFKELILMARENKIRIRDAAVEVISRQGFFNTRMQDIADQAGLAVGTIYNYFHSKDKVLVYIFKSEMKKRLEIISNLKEKELTTKNFLKVFLEKQFAFLIKNPHLGRVLVREKDFSRSEKSTQIREYRNSLIKLLEDIFDNGIKRGALKEINTHLLAVYFFGSIQGIIEYALTEAEVELLEAAPDFIMKRINNIFI